MNLNSLYYLTFLVLLSCFCISSNSYAFQVGYKYNIGGTFNSPNGSYTLNDNSFLYFLRPYASNDFQHIARVSVNAFDLSREPGDRWFNAIFYFAYNPNELQNGIVNLSAIPSSDVVNYEGVDYSHIGDGTFPQGEYSFYQFMNSQIHNQSSFFIWYGAESALSLGTFAFTGAMHLFVNPQSGRPYFGDGGGPSTPIPEPMTLGLLGAGLLSRVFNKKKLL